MRPTFLATLCSALISVAGHAHADEVLEAIDAAREAYLSGDKTYAEGELKFAIDLLKEAKLGNLETFFPPAPDGWEMEIDSGATTGLAALGGAASVAKYSKDKSELEISIMMDNPLVSQMGLMASSGTMAGGKRVRVGREKFTQMDDNIIGMIDGRILVQGSGDDMDLVVELLKEIDYKSLADFGT